VDSFKTKKKHFFIGAKHIKTSNFNILAKQYGMRFEVISLLFKTRKNIANGFLVFLIAARVY
jgi:hypothetical protein